MRVLGGDEPLARERLGRRAPARRTVGSAAARDAGEGGRRASSSTATTAASAAGKMLDPPSKSRHRCLPRWAAAPDRAGRHPCAVPSLRHAAVRRGQRRAGRRAPSGPSPACPARVDLRASGRAGGSAARRTVMQPLGGLMRVLVVGGGGREHALVHSFAQSPLAERIFCAPGNAGTAAEADNIPIAADDLPALLDFASREKVDLTVIGPEAPLVVGPHRPVRGARPRRVRPQQGGLAARGQQGLRQGGHGRRRRGHRRVPPARAAGVGARRRRGPRGLPAGRQGRRPGRRQGRPHLQGQGRGARGRARPASSRASSATPATCSSPRSTSPAPRSRCWCSATARRRCRSRRRRTTSASSPATRGPTPAAWAATARCRGSSRRPSTPRWSTWSSPSSPRCAGAASPTAACCTPA